MEPLTEGRSIKISELASELAVSDEQLGNLVSELQDILAKSPLDWPGWGGHFMGTGGRSSRSEGKR